MNLAEAQISSDIAVDRMRDAESYALWIEMENELLKLEAERKRKSALIGFSFGGVSFGTGVPLITEGVRSNNGVMLWSGVAIAGAGSLVWVAGHYLFKLW